MDDATKVLHAPNERIRFTQNNIIFGERSDEIYAVDKKIYLLVCALKSFFSSKYHPKYSETHSEHMHKL